ncbi:ubiquitin carboxyl-terminal hydrolase 44-like [Clavelina lepadiformis]|uniref:ubiquitinyl hydrolase 1 n=1 Tax=Clavelina lepadiformis TaxID=159417 RepID=A0ABP0GFC5_CLALP
MSNFVMDKMKKSPDSDKKREAKVKPKSEFSQDELSHHEVQYLTRCTRFRLSTEYELSICNCKHIMRMTIGERHSVVNPQRWLCNICFTTESVWACLSCPNVACGRYIHEHALDHYEDSHHPLVIDVNELYVYCYECEEYVLNDNKSGDIKVLRETLQAIRYQNFTGTTRSGHTLRTASITADEDVQMRRRLQQQQLDRDDRTFTAIWHSRFVRQRKSFRRWLHYVKHKKDYEIKEDQDKMSENFAVSESATESLPDTSNDLLIHSTVSKQELKVTGSYSNLLETKKQSTVTQTTVAGDISVSNTSPAFSGNGSKDILDCTSINDVPVVEYGEKPIPPLGEKAIPEKVDTCLPITEKSELVSSTRKVSKEEYIEVAASASVSFDGHNHHVTETSSVTLSPDKLSPEADVTKSSNIDNTQTESRIEVSELAPDVKLLPEDVKKENSKILLQVEPERVNSGNSVQMRPRRANAASRYKAIMTFFASPSTTVEPSKKRVCLVSSSSTVEKKPTLVHENIQPVTRRSLRLIEVKKAKLAAEAKQRRKSRKCSRKATVSKRTNQGSKPKPRKKVPARPLPSNRTRIHNATPQSFYDNVPNKAVTSLIPGVTGLRNLGNTCYLNSIIQVLGHLQKFRRCLLAVRDLEIEDTTNPFDDIQTLPKRLHCAGRRSTIEMYENQTSVSRRFLRIQAGLNGGRESETDEQNKDQSAYSPQKHVGTPNSLSLCHELHDLYHIMWSGKWKLVSPCHFLSSVWQLIPSFRGYSQQDAQEFLCELLDKIVSELERRRRSPTAKKDRLAARISKVVHTVFEGQLHSQVMCLECNNISSTYEAFWDLSLEFPERYHRVSNSSWKNNNQACSLIEMLHKFTEAEQLDGGRVYSCSYCNSFQSQPIKGTNRRRRLSSRIYTQKLSEAQKQIKIIELPQILRFHLKRFRWSGRNHREKISVPVSFPAELDMRPHCWSSVQDSFSGCSPITDGNFIYDLSAVVIHHGRGFGSGHYTAYCWNDIGKFWVHCNDSNLELCSIDDVMSAQAYILFYSQRGLDPHPHLFSPPTTPDMSPPITPDAFSVMMDEGKSSSQNLDSSENG